MKLYRGRRLAWLDMFSELGVWSLHATGGGRMRRAWLGLGVFGVCAVMLMAGGSPAFAATETPVDCGAGADLQAAIDAAPRGAVLGVSGTCLGSFTIQRTITLRGVSSAVLDGQGLGTTVTISNGNVHLSHLAVTGGNADYSAGFGGGIYNAGRLTLVRTTVTNNGSSDGGGGIYTSGSLILRHSTVTQNYGDDYEGGILSDGASVTVHKSTISKNQGSGITIYGTGSLALTDSTVSGNGSMPEAGGINIYESNTTSTILRSTIANNNSGNGITGGVYNAGAMTITESTITGNEGDGYPGGVLNDGSLTISATIIAANEGSDCQGTITSNGYNLIGIVAPTDPDLPACDFTPRSTDKVGTTTPLDPHLLALGNYGGPTQTVKPAADSPAVDAIPVGALTADGTTQLCAASGSVDQRGTRRPKGPACDIGSVER
jgi:predicted outer membrane repeat protein